MQTIGLIGAMEEEVTLLRAQIENLQTKQIAGFEFYTGQIHGKSVVLLRSGIGKVNAAISATILMMEFKPTAVINIGSAGGFHPNLEIGDVVISDGVCHHDVDLSVFGYELGQLPGLPPCFLPEPGLVALAETAVAELGEVKAMHGLIASGDRFMHDQSDVALTRDNFPKMIACEMEAAAIAQVCHQFDTGFVIIRALSDIAGKENAVAFEEFLPKAAAHSSKVVSRILQNL